MMSHSITLFIFLRLFIQPGNDLVISSDNSGYYETVYFWIDTWCESCDPNERQEPGKYFVINDALLEADYDDAEVIVDSFKKVLQKEFKNYENLVNSCVFRYKKTREEAVRHRKAQLEKMESQGYKIIEIPFSDRLSKVSK